MQDFGRINAHQITAVECIPVYKLAGENQMRLLCVIFEIAQEYFLMDT